MKVGEIGEDRLLARLLPALSRDSSVVLGAGDDCAIVRAPGRGCLQLLKTDCIVEGIHFNPDSSPVSVGWKAMARPLSDFAAMSGLPQFALITMIIPAKKTLAWTKALYRGLESAARAFEVAIVGGETSAINGPAAISISMTGFVEKGRWVGRGGGKAKDDLFVTGRLGGSLRGKHLKFTPRIEESRWLTEHFSIHAMMDLSDGLGADLPRLARASGVRFEVEESALPLQRGCSITQAISDGEDYELLFAIPPKDSSSLERRWRRRFPQIPLTRIGRFTSSFGIPARNAAHSVAGGGRSSLPPGYVHFK
jgi:thiamine-monophosphate kinase